MNVLQESRMLSSVIRRQLPVISKALPIISTSNISTDNEKPQYKATPPQYHLSYLDKITLKIFGNMKGDIPDEVSYAVMERADSMRRIAANVFLMVSCSVGFVYIAHNVKKNLKNKTEGNVYDRNHKRYEDK